MLINIVDVADGALVNAIAVVGRRLSVAFDGMRGRRRARDLSVARWFETYRLTRKIPALPELSPALAQRLATALRGNEVQAALHELLAARLSDAPESHAVSARHVLSRTLNAADPGAAQFAEALTRYYDDEIRALVRRLKADNPPLLATIRSEAFAARMINILNAIERHTAALAARPDQGAEADFLWRYRGHVIDQHGKLEPPDFDRRRRVPIAEIFVPTVIFRDLYRERAFTSDPLDQPSLNVFGLVAELDRTVLLGDPGSGKTTTANVLMHNFALDPADRIPFLVTLRDYAAKDPPERSIADHIEHTLETFYQCLPPPGLVNLLLLTGRAVVIFDGLDELLDTSHRRSVTNRVERFCAEYPLCPVLVTSRLVGYDQARLDDRQFTCYQLGGFDEAEVAEYVRKWFAGDRDARPGDGDAFLNESDNVPDLRSNPLMLALLCILYRGEGSLPRNRAEVYEQCAIMLFRKWDARRRIHQELRAGHLLESVLRHLAWWLYTGDDARSAVTERELIAATTKFLRDSGFESEDDARSAAREFIEFSRGRMWVFSDAGTTATGEKLYAFSHRTFLEYFAAAQLAYDNDSPEQLASTILPRIARNEWWVVAELAVQIKHRTSNGGASRIYAALVEDGSLRNTLGRPDVLRFLALCLRSVDPSPKRVRELTRQLLTEAFDAERPGESADGLTGITGHNLFRSTSRWQLAVRQMLTGCGSYRDVVAAGVDAVITDKIRSGNQTAFLNSVRLALSLSRVWRTSSWARGEQEQRFWEAREEACIDANIPAVLTVAESDTYVRLVALRHGFIDTRQALDLPGGLNVLCQETGSFFNDSKCEPYLAVVFQALMEGWPAFGSPEIVNELSAIGEYLITADDPPWLNIDSVYSLRRIGTAAAKPSGTAFQLSPTAYLGAAVLFAAFTEVRRSVGWTAAQLGPLQDIMPYLARRSNATANTDFADLPVPDEFRWRFRDWAVRRTHFVTDDWERFEGTVGLAAWREDISFAPGYP